MGNIERAVGLTDYFVALPPTRYIMLAIIVLGVIFGIGTNIEKYSGTELILKGAFQGILVLSIPAIISASVIKILIFRIPFKRIAATTLVGEVIYAITYSAGMVVSSFNPTYAKFVFLVGASLVFVMWYAIARLVFILKWRSFIFAVIQLMFHIIFLLSSSIMDFGSEPVAAITKFYIASLVFLAAIYIFFMIINAPMRRNFGLSSTDAISMFAAQWLYQDKELEGAFESVGETAVVPLSLFAFERKGRGRVFFVIPSVHFGPFGNLGGSEFSYLIADEIAKKYDAKAFVFHAPVTHDLNPVSSNEIYAVMKAIDDCVSGAKFSKANVSFIEGRHEECFSQMLLFGDCVTDVTAHRSRLARSDCVTDVTAHRSRLARSDSAFVSLSRAPYVTEDINFGLGAFIAAEAEKNVSLAAIVDQHNSETGEILSFEPGSVVGYNYLEAVKEAFAGIKRAKQRQLEIGISMRELRSPFIGRAGLKVAVFSTEPAVALILIDANGITPEFRERLMDEAKRIGQECKKNIRPIILTTDTHKTNSVRGVLNPLREDDGVVKEIRSAVREAIGDMSKAKFFATKKWFSIGVLGAKQAIEIVSTVNSIVAVAKIVGPIILVGSIAVIIAIVSSV